MKSNGKGQVFSSSQPQKAFCFINHGQKFFSSKAFFDSYYQGFGNLVWRLVFPSRLFTRFHLFLPLLTKSYIFIFRKTTVFWNFFQGDSVVKNISHGQILCYDRTLDSGKKNQFVFQKMSAMVYIFGGRTKKPCTLATMIWVNSWSNTPSVCPL